MKLDKKWTVMGRDKGASLVEYGMLVGLIAIVAIAAVFGLGGGVSSAFNQSEAALSSAQRKPEGTAQENGSPRDEDVEGLVLSRATIKRDGGSIFVPWTFLSPGYFYRLNGEVMSDAPLIDYDYMVANDLEEVLVEMTAPRMGKCALGNLDMSMTTQTNRPNKTGVWERVSLLSYEHDSAGWMRMRSYTHTFTSTTTGEVDTEEAPVAPSWMKVQENGTVLMQEQPPAIEGC